MRCGIFSYDDDRKLYYVLCTFGKNADGKYTKSYVTTRTKAEARRILAEHKKRIAAGTVIPLASDTLVARTEEFIRYKELSLAKSTIYGYKMILENHIRPYFKDIRIQAITPADLRNYATHMSTRRENKLSNTSIRRHMDLLSAVFDQAFNDELIPFNPLTRIEKIKPDTKEKTIYTAEELIKLIQSVKGTSLELPVYLGGLMGMRREEMAGLKWENINWKNHTLTISSVRTQVGGIIDEKEPKTAKSRRTLAIPDEVYEALQKEYKKEIKSKKMGERLERSSYVITKPNGQPVRPNYISDRLCSHIRKYKMKPLTLHGLRHSFASLASHSSVPLQDISSALGHASPSITAGIYVHELDPVKSVAIKAVTKNLEEAKEK